MLTITFKTQANGVIKMHSIQSDTENFNILWEDFVDIEREAYRIIGQLSIKDVKDREAMYFHLENVIGGQVVDSRTVDVCVILDSSDVKRK